MPKKHEKPEVEPRVGIFWLYGRRLITDSTPLSKAEPYGDALTHATGHIDFRSMLQRRRTIPADVEYDEPPRGRVGYDKRHATFFLFADSCIIANPAAPKAIIGTFHLPKNITPQKDAHYRCATLRGSS
ncbi:MAG: hypothetical protein ROO76_20745 [Terriglobia bacterium]|jgi:hypothetical protein|nr:hypothetical protein [Terriglobia bacterium]